MNCSQWQEWQDAGYATGQSISNQALNINIYAMYPFLIWVGQFPNLGGPKFGNFLIWWAKFGRGAFFQISVTQWFHNRRRYVITD